MSRHRSTASDARPRPLTAKCWRGARTLVRVASALAAAATLDACGAKSNLGDFDDAATSHVSTDSGTTATDANTTSTDVSPDGPVTGTKCELGPNLLFEPSDCGTSDMNWFAYPYTPPQTITVTDMSVHTDGGSVAILSAGTGGPGTPLFVASIPRGPAGWQHATVSPPVRLVAGQLYYLVARSSYCSQTMGGTELTEYIATSVDGPWTIPGVGSFTARLDGICE